MKERRSVLQIISSKECDGVLNFPLHLIFPFWTVHQFELAFYCTAADKYKQMQQQKKQTVFYQPYTTYIGT